MLPQLIKCGISVFDFWDLTMGEMTMILNANAEVLKQQLQQQAQNTYVLANLIGLSVSRMFGSTNYPTINEVYPNLFDNVKAKERTWEDMKQTMLDYTEAHNKKFKKGANN